MEVAFRDKANCRFEKAGTTLVVPKFVAVEEDVVIVVVLISVLVLVTVLVVKLVIVEVVGGGFVETTTVETDCRVVV